MLNLISISFRSSLKNRKYLLIQLRGKRKEALRKPIWDPIAPSKLFRVPIKPQYDEEETDQRRVLDLSYKSMYRSIKSYFRKEFYLPTLEAGGFTPEQVKAEEEEQKRLLEENNIENTRVERERQQRQHRQREQHIGQLILQDIQRKENWKVLAQKIDQQVKQELERSKTYITKETLDSAIEQALENPVSYDYAIDVHGNVYYDDKLHPYAFKPSDVPETSSNTEEFVGRDKIKVKLEPTKLY